MSRITTDPNDPRLTKGEDAGPVEQAEAYLVLETKHAIRVRPVRDRYVHLRMADGGDLPRVLPTGADTVGCGVETRMGPSIAETYAVNPDFYSHTYCVGCKRHLPVGEFSWDDGTAVGS